MSTHPFIKYIYLILFHVLAITTYAQQKWIVGNIIIDNTEEVAEGIYVTNKRTNHTTKSNFAGTFFIQAQENDTLLFRSDWYENRNIILKKNLYNKDQIVVHLALTNISLSEALITKKLTGILEKDVFVGKKEDDVTRLYRLLNVNPDINPIQDTTALKAGLLSGDIRLTGMDVGRIYDVFSGNLRKRKALMDYEFQRANIAQIRAYYGENFYKIELKIPSHKINEFILAALNNTNNTDQLNNPNYFSLLNILRDYSEIYLNDLFKARINQEFKYIEPIDQSNLYIGVPLDSIPKH